MAPSPVSLHGFPEGATVHGTQAAGWVQIVRSSVPCGPLPVPAPVSKRNFLVQKKLFLQPSLPQLKSPAGNSSYSLRGQQRGRILLGQSGHGAAAEAAPKTPGWKTRAWQGSVSPAEFYNILPPAFCVLF